MTIKSGYTEWLKEAGIDPDCYKDGNEIDRYGDEFDAIRRDIFDLKHSPTDIITTGNYIRHKIDNAIAKFKLLQDRGLSISHKRTVNILQDARKQLDLPGYGKSEELMSMAKVAMKISEYEAVINCQRRKK